MQYRNDAGFPKHNIAVVFSSLAGVIQSLCYVCTLGFYAPPMHLWIARPFSKRGWF